MWEIVLWASLAVLVYLLFRPRPEQHQAIIGHAMHLLFALPFGILATLFLINDTSILHVALYGGEQLPLRYRFAATWAAREGPLLLWFGWMGLLAFLYRGRLSGETEDIHALRLRFHYGIMLILLLISISLKPFETVDGLIRSQGLNPLLQTDLMVIHPPLIFLAYSYCLVLATVGLSTMFSMEETKIASRLIPLLRPAFFITTLGIGLGGLWAYLILDWGGYWAWDPVETGSFLPWIVLAMMVHLRTRPGKTSESLWIGASFVAAFMAIFATLVTRAGGVWATSVHTFVQDDAALVSSDVFFRFMALRESEVALEIMSYLLMCFMLVGAWLALICTKRDFKGREKQVQLTFFVPVFLALIALLVGPEIYQLLPPIAYLLFGCSPLLMTYLINRRLSRPEIITILLVVVSIFIVQDVMLITGFLCFLFALQYAEEQHKWGWATAGIALAIAAAWSNMVSIYQAGLMLLMFMHPWLLNASQEQHQSKIGYLLKPRFALWGSVVIAGVYLILTWVILLSSIDSVSFETHELYGSPFLFALGCSFYIYMGRHLEKKPQMFGLVAVVLFSIVGLLFAPHSWGFDANHSISEVVDRGHLAWIVLPIMLVSGPFVLHEIVLEAKKRRAHGLRLNSISFKAHMVHLGLVLLIVGHIFTTTLVDRGDASHRVTLVRDEVVIHDGYGYMFTGVDLTSENLEVGDGLITLSIDVYEVSDGEIGDKLTTVEPGVLRFDSTLFPRSEVDTYTRLTGDTVIIFDGTQAASLMQNVQQDGTESVELVRVTLYTLRGSHLVWIGWSIMLLGMLSLAVPTFARSHSEEE
ncbi:MAG: cytochrome c biogenesis protein CcsA [Candidatus Poseidoniales archaeon]